jgi:hypothetical protein
MKTGEREREKDIQGERRESEEKMERERVKDINRSYRIETDRGG